MLHKRNIRRSKGTTILGISLILAGVASVFTNNASWTEVIVVIGTGLWLMFDEDPTGTVKDDNKEQN